MYLLNSSTIERYIRESRSSPLKIHDFNREGLKESSYYFRLGAIARQAGKKGLIEMSENEPFELKPSEYIVVESLERFVLSDRIFGIFGSHSDFIKSGLELVHSPFIDPNFDDKLRLGIGNRFGEPQLLRKGQDIGKITFFDVSDTYPIQGKPMKNEAT